MQATVDCAEDSADEISSSAPIRTYILQGQLLVAKSLHLALDQEPDIHVVGSQNTTSLAVERILNAGADVVLLDVSLEAVDLATRLQRSSAPPRVIVTSANVATELLLPCIESGVV